MICPTTIVITIRANDYLPLQHPQTKKPQQMLGLFVKLVITPIFLTEALNQTNRRLNHSQPLGKSVLLGLC